MAVRYGTPQFFCSEVRYSDTVRLFCNGTGTLVRCLNLPTFYAKRAAVSEDLCDRALPVHSLGYSHVIIIAS